jgi:hypothetical protein
MLLAPARLALSQVSEDFIDQFTTDSFFSKNSRYKKISKKIFFGFYIVGIPRSQGSAPEVPSGQGSTTISFFKPMSWLEQIMTHHRDETALLVSGRLSLIRPWTPRSRSSLNSH